MQTSCCEVFYQPLSAPPPSLQMHPVCSHGAPLTPSTPRHKRSLLFSHILTLLQINPVSDSPMDASSILPQVTSAPEHRVYHAVPWHHTCARLGLTLPCDHSIPSTDVPADILPHGPAAAAPDPHWGTHRIHYRRCLKWRGGAPLPSHPRHPCTSVS